MIIMAAGVWILLDNLGVAKGWVIWAIILIALGPWFSAPTCADPSDARSAEAQRHVGYCSHGLREVQVEEPASIPTGGLGCRLRDPSA